MDLRLRFLEGKLEQGQLRGLHSKLENLIGETVNLDYFEETIKYAYDLTEEDSERLLEVYNIEIKEEAEGEIFKVIKFDYFDEEVEEFDTLDKANKYAYSEWEHLTDSEKKKQRIYVTEENEQDLIGFDSDDLVELQKQDWDSEEDTTKLEDKYLEDLGL